jgi:hypothetical protein
MPLSDQPGRSAAQSTWIISNHQIQSHQAELLEVFRTKDTLAARHFLSRKLAFAFYGLRPDSERL